MQCLQRRFLTSSRHNTWRFTRRLHSAKELGYPIANGVGDFLTPEGLKVLAQDYQNGLLDRLNDEVRIHSLEKKSVAQTVIETAQRRDLSLAFNYASLALNNSFFLQTLKPPPNGTSYEIDNNLLSQITNDYSSLGNFISTFSAAALGLNSSAFLWLVMDQKQNLAIVPTFGPGTLLVRSRELRVPSWGANVLGADPTDGERPGSRFYRGSSPTSGNVIQPRLTPNPPTQTRNSSSYSQRRSMLDNIRGGSAPLPSNLNFLGQTLSPLFCISLCEHAWLTSGYGVWGKEEYLKRFWGVLDWDKVGRNFDYFSSIL